MKLRFLAMPLILGVALTLTPLMALGRSEGSIKKTWDYPENVQTLIIDADRQDVIVKAGGPRLTGRLVGDTGDVVKTSRSGDTVTITVRTDRSWFSWRPKSSRIEVSVPEGLTVDVTTASGAVLVQVPTQSLRVRSASGDIEAARGGVEADVDSASGTVRLKGFSGPIKASTLSGDLLLENIAGSIQAATLSGDLEGSGLAPDDQSRFTTVSGDAVLKLKGGAKAYQIRSETVSGDITIGDQTSENELRAGTEGPSFVVKSVSGDILVK